LEQESDGAAVTFSPLKTTQQLLLLLPRLEQFSPGKDKPLNNIGI
jgi:hypothetical protein